MKNIRDKFIISIIDNNGVKQFNVHRFIKKVLFYFIGFFAIVAVVLYFTMRFLASELTDMQGRKDDTIEKYAEVYKENLALRQEVDKSQEQLDEVNKKILDLEDVISMKNSIIEAKEANPFAVESLSQSQREMLLQIVPNAKPFSEKITAQPQMQRRGAIFEIPNATPIVATADGIIDLTRSNDTTGIGKFVKIVHTFGFNSIYGHLSKLSVRRGDVVKKGQIIGYSGKHNGKPSVFYDIRFLGSEVKMAHFIAWNLEDFNAVMSEDSIVNWDSLLWTFNDILQITSHKVLTQDTRGQMR